MIKTCETMVYCISKPNEWGSFEIQLFNFTKTAEVSELTWLCGDSSKWTVKLEVHLMVHKSLSGIWSSKKIEPQNLKFWPGTWFPTSPKKKVCPLRRICERSSAGSTTCPMGKIWIWWVIPSSGSRFPILSLKWIDRSHTKPGVLVDSRILFFRALGGAVPGSSRQFHLTNLYSISVFYGQFASSSGFIPIPLEWSLQIFRLFAA